VSHPDAEMLMRHAEGLLRGADAEGVAGHLATCQECREKGNSMHAFAARLNTDWIGERLKTLVPREWGCPSADELSRYFRDETAPPERERIQAHLDECRGCRDVLTEMEDLTAALVRADPLAVRVAEISGSWWERFRAALDLMPGPAWAGAAVAVSLAFLAGFLLRPILIAPFPTGLEPYRIAKPQFTPPAEGPAFGIAPSVKPEADQRFREAMAFYAEPDFPNKAIPKLKEAVALDPRHDQAQFWLGIAYLLRGETVTATPPLEEAVRLAPGKTEYKQYLVWAYLKTGETDKALRLQTQILERR